MAQRALPAGAIRRRSFFGLLDADGWTAASLKALFWFLLIIFLLGYVPDRAYYFTVSPTIDVGYNVISPINFCDPSNRTLPCPAPAGAVVPWEPAPAELALPAPRVGAAAVQSGANLYLVGGRSGDAATAEVLATSVTTEGNFAPWTAGPALPDAREDAATVSLAGVPYVIGGLDGNGQPTTTVFEGTLENGVLTGWRTLDGGAEQGGAARPNLALPTPLSGASAVASAAGLYLMGGRAADGLSTTLYHAPLDGDPPTLGAWEEVGAMPMPEGRADAVAVLVGGFGYIMGGEGPNGITDTIYRLQLTGEGGLATDAQQQLVGWATAPAGQTLPAPRSRASGFTANSALYLIGGVDESGVPQGTTFWSVPSPTTGDIPQWLELAPSNLPEGRADAALTNVGSFAFLVGGEGPAGPVDSSMRSNLSPKPPFFRLGLFGATIPALSIKGEIGQQLGYLNAFGVGMTNFVILVAVGVALSHRQQTMRLLNRVTRGRVRAPREEDEETLVTGR